MTCQRYRAISGARDSVNMGAMATRLNLLDWIGECQNSTTTSICNCLSQLPSDAHEQHDRTISYQAHHLCTGTHCNSTLPPRKSTLTPRHNAQFQGDQETHLNRVYPNIPPIPAHSSGEIVKVRRIDCYGPVWYECGRSLSLTTAVNELRN